LTKTPINLEEAYTREKNGLPAIIASDPVEFVHCYRNVLDKEIAGFLASQFAYGKIEVMKRFLRDLFERMGDSPERFVREGRWESLNGLYYRFQKSDEIVLLFGVLNLVYDRYASLGELLRTAHQGDIRKTVWSLRNHLHLKDDELIFFFPKPLAASPMKRWSLYLRWMVRKDEIDSGIWDFVDKRGLVVPLDTHLFKIGRCLGWTKRKSPSWHAALEITNALKEACPEDPLKYDFFLCHKVGIGAGCTGDQKAECDEKCVLIG
jgi:uncharacterized protein (TIGR02757 family)